MAILPWTWPALAVVLMTVGLGRGLARRRGLPFPDLGNPFWLGLACYAISFAAANSWRLAGDDVGLAVDLWQVHIAALVGLYGALAAYLGARQAWGLVCLGLACAALASLIGAPATQKGLEVLGLVAVFGLVLACFNAIPKRQLGARLVWLILAFAEGWAVVEGIDCQLLHNPMAPRFAGSACGHIYGWGIQWLQPMVTVVILGYIAGRYINRRL